MKASALVIAAVALCAVLGAPGGGASADQDDHDRPRRALESGEIKPLRDILAHAERAHGGRLIEAELENEHGRMVYELKLLTVEGRLVKLYYDARSGLPLNGEPRGDRK